MSTASQRRRPAGRTQRRLGGDRPAGAANEPERPLKPHEVAQVIADRPATTPGDHGDPFEPDISDDERAKRLEGRKLLHVGLNWGNSTEILYRVELFRRTIHRTGSPPLIQFYGRRATRQWRVGESKPKDWSEVESESRLHTVDLDPKELRLQPVKRNRRK